MTVIVLHIEVTRAGTGTLNTRVWNGIKRRLWKSVAQYWIDEIRPKHFTKGGAKEYGYSPRQGETGASGKAFWRSYTGRKQRKFGHTKPLTWSGAFERDTRSSRIQATQHGSTVRIRGRVLNLGLVGTGKKIDMAKEVSTVSPRDVHMLTRHMQSRLEREMNERNLRKDKVVIKVG
jgi:hypothetical protein